MTQAAEARSRAPEATSFILKALGAILSEDRSNEIRETVEVVTSSKKLFVYGVGRSGLAARAFAMRMVQLGRECFFIGETITPVVGDGDAVLIVSNTGSTASAIQVANIARRVGAKVVSLTGSRSSKLAHASNVVVTVQTNSEPNRSRLAPLGTLFEDACLILLDGVVAEVMDRLGQTEAEMRGRHAIMV